MELGTCRQKEDIRDIKLGVDLTREQQDQIMGVLKKHETIFTDLPGKTNLIQHKICLTDNTPIKSKPYPLPYAMREELKGEIGT